MLRFVLSAMALAGTLATTLPAFAEPPATASDHAQVAATATPPPAPAVPARSSTSASPARDGHDADIIPVGLGWG